jgi:hypothetical protein
VARYTNLEVLALACIEGTRQDMTRLAKRKRRDLELSREIAYELVKTSQTDAFRRPSFSNCNYSGFSGEIQRDISHDDYHRT